MRRSTIATFLVSALALLAVESAANGQAVGQPFPNFDAVDPISGKRLDLNSFRGRVVLIDFWATWCGPCVAELPNIKQVHQNFHDKGFEIISISLDQDKAKFKSFVSSRGMNWHHVMDGGGWNTRLAKRFGIRSIPKMYLIDAEGICVGDSLRGPRLAQAVEEALKNVSNPPAGAAGQERVSTKAPAAIGEFRKELDALAGELHGYARPLQQAIEKLQHARHSCQALAAAAPGSSSMTDLSNLRSELIPIRQELFMLGLLNDRQVALPAGGSGTNDLSFALGALSGLESAATDAHKRLQDMAVSVEALREKFASQPTTLELARKQFNDVSGPARQLAAEWRTAWKKQLAGLEGVLSSYAQQEAAVSERLAAVQRKLGDVRLSLMRDPRTARTFRRLRDDFSAVRADLDELRNLIAGAETASIALPLDPFANRAVEDPAAARELEAQIKVADQALADLKSRATQRNDGIKRCQQKFAERIAKLQAESKKPTVNAEASEALRREFSALCGEILATLG